MAAGEKYREGATRKGQTLLCYCHLSLRYQMQQEALMAFKERGKICILDISFWSPWRVEFEGSNWSQGISFGNRQELISVVKRTWIRVMQVKMQKE